MPSGSVPVRYAMPFSLAAAGLSILGLCAGFALCELTCRLLQPWMPEYVFYEIPTRISSADEWRYRRAQSGELAGGRFSIDAAGFRNGGSHQSYDRTVLFIGDSFTFGYGVTDEDTLVVAVEKQLAAAGINARCLNAGVPRFGTAHELRLLNRLLAKDRVDAVVFQVYTGNDLEDNWEDGGFRLENGVLTVNDPAQIPLRVQMREWLAPLGHLHSVAVSALALSLYRHWLGPSIDANDFDLEGALLQAVVNTVRAKNIPLIMFVVPPPTPPWVTYARMVDLVNASGAESVDLERAVGRSEYYLPGHGHFSPAGNAAVGAALAERLIPLLRGSAGAPG